MTKRQSARTKKGEAIVMPNDTDVLFGRGGHVNHHPANQKYLELVTMRKDQYHNCKKVDKASVAWDIIRELREQDPPARFLRKDYSTGLWHIVKDTEVRRKISQCLRERSTPVITSKKKKSRRKGAITAKWVCVEGPKEREEHDTQSTRIVEDKKVAFSSKSSLQDEEMELEDKDTVEELPALPSGEPLKAVQSQTPQQVFQTQRNECPSGNQTEDVAFEAPTPIPPPSKLEESNRVWSDFFASSFASFTPSIFDSSLGGENTWENLLDPTMLPQLCDIDEESFPESCLSGGQLTDYDVADKQKTSLPLGQVIHCDDRHGDSDGNSNCHEETIEPISVDSFYSCDMSNLGKVLQNSHLLSVSSTGV